jgi:hypothetical protein
MELILSEKRNCKEKCIYPSHTFLTKFVSPLVYIIARERSGFSLLGLVVCVCVRERSGGREGRRKDGERGGEREGGRCRLE